MQTRVDYSSQGSTFHTYYSNDASGQLVSANVQDGRPRWISVTRDALGQAIRRDEAKQYGNNGQGGDPHEIWYRFNGRQIGYVGNNGSDNGDYTASIAQRTAPSPSGTPGAFRGGASYGEAYADFDQNYDAINTFAQGSGAQGPGGGTYTVRQGDTLSSIAAQLWGDASLWYKLAAANGLSGDTALTVGQTLTTPAGVTKAGNTAATFRPYDPSDAYGDTSPTTPKPQAAHGGGCGGFGAILLVVIAVAVTVVATAGATAAISGQAFGAVLGSVTSGTAVAGVSTAAWIAGGTIGAAIGSAVSQGIGVATGLQDKFSWSGVALAAIGGGIGAGLAGAFPGGGILGAAARGAAGSAITQGIGVVTGLQSKFDFAGVAAAGIGAGISGALQARFTAGANNSFTFGERLAANAAGGLANAATRSLVNGTDFGDNILAALPDIIGNTIGSALANGVAGIGSKNRVDRALNAPITDAEAKRAEAAIAADPVQSLEWGGKILSKEDAQKVIVSRMRYEELAKTWLGENDGFKSRYADFRSALAANDSYNEGSNETLLGSNLVRVTSGKYIEGINSGGSDGYRGYLYEDRISSGYIFANAGTNDSVDIKTNFALGDTKEVDQLNVARDNALRLVRNGVPNLRFTGHSLGGALAILQGLRTGLPVTTFNSAPFTATLDKVYNLNIADADHLVTNYRIANDPLSIAENNHAVVTGAAILAKALPLIGPLVPPDGPEHAWRLAPPPGRIITLPQGGSVIDAHSMLTVLSQMTQYWHIHLDGSGR